ncbi:MAG: PilZ domain-containing protein [Thermodesulfobacteriota bacterium]|nr:MAG: PilZ domain-containing protein [Thermodesulfobacteriota bacterium]
MDWKPPSAHPQAQGSAGPQPRPPRLSLGEALIVEISKLDIRLKSVLVGFEAGSFLLIKLSPNDLMGMFRSETVVRNPVTVKFQVKDAVYSFNTEILNIVSNPSKLMFLAFPGKIEELKIRPELRRQCALPAMIMLNNEIIDMQIVDLSARGCQCSISTSGRNGETLRKLMHVNAAIEILVNFPETRERLKLTGRVRNIGNDGDRLNIGVMFEGLVPETSARVESFLTKSASPG